MAALSVTITPASLSVVRSKYPLGDHTQVYQPKGGDVFIPMPGLEKEPQPEWMKTEVLAVPKFREVILLALLHRCHRCASEAEGRCFI